MGSFQRVTMEGFEPSTPNIQIVGLYQTEIHGLEWIEPQTSLYPVIDFTISTNYFTLYYLYNYVLLSTFQCQLERLEC